MPINATTIMEKLQAALVRSNGKPDSVISSSEIAAFKRLIDSQGIDREGAAVLWKTLDEFVDGGRILNERSPALRALRERALNEWLHWVNERAPFPPSVNIENGKTYVQLMREVSGDPLPQGKTTILPKSAFGGQEIGITDQGALTVDGQEIQLNLAEPDAKSTSALWALNRPAQLLGVDAAARDQLAEKIRAAVMDALQIDAMSPPVFRRNVAVCAGLGALASMAEHWSQATCADMLKAAESAPTVLDRALVFQGLKQAPLSPAQQQAFAKLTQPEHAEALLDGFNRIRREEAEAGWQAVTGLAAEIALAAMTFAKSSDSIDGILGGLGPWAQVLPCWGAEPMAKLAQVLEAYVDGNKSLGYIYGSFRADAPVQAAKVISEAAVAEVLPALRAEPPTLLDYPLTRAQADFLLSPVQKEGPAIIESVQNREAIENMVRCLATAGSIFEAAAPDPWGVLPRAEKPLNPAAFKLFQRAVTEYQDRIAESIDRKLTYEDLLEEMRYQTDEVRQVLYPRVKELQAESPTWRGLALDATAKTYLLGLLTERIRGTMSVENLDRAVQTVAAKYGNALQGDGAAKFREIVDGYMANWPAFSFLDFNKLERIARCSLDPNLKIPTFAVNGESIPMGFFYTAVGLTVQQKCDTSAFAEAPWMAARWGFRAKQAIEVLDAIAERAVRNEGPLAVLRAQYPGQPIRIDVMGSAGEHNMFIFQVAGRSFVEEVSIDDAGGTRGVVTAHVPDGKPLPRLFSAAIDAQGGIALTVDTLKPTTYPLQNTYGVGCKIDVKIWDKGAPEEQEEENPFSTQYKVREGVILGFKADGTYRIGYSLPDGKSVQENVPLATIRNANDPHMFRHHTGKAADMWEIGLNHAQDEYLRQFEEEAAAVGDRFVPRGDATFDPVTGAYTGNSIVALSAKELQQVQQACNKALLRLAAKWLIYPADKDSGHLTPEDREYHRLQDENGWLDKIPFGSLLRINRGVCRHQAIADQVMDQIVGIDSRIAIGAANTETGMFRGFHAWSEDSLVLGFRVLDDQTWGDTNIPLWTKAYGVDMRRQEMHNRTSSMDKAIVV